MFSYLVLPFACFVFSFATSCSCTIFLVDEVNNWKFFQFQYTRSYAIVKAFFTHIIMHLSNFCTLRSESATKK